MAIAAMVALFSVWLILPELIRPSLPAFPTNAAAARTAADHRTRSVVAASIAQVRGDLWTEAAVSAAAPIGFGLALTGSSAANGEIEDRSIFERAVRWSPADSRAWLAFAAANPGGGAAEPSVTELLKLSYLTGPNEIDLVPMRLAVVARGSALEDADVRQFARHDLENVLQHARRSAARDHGSVSPRFAQRPAIHRGCAQRARSRVPQNVSGCGAGLDAAAGEIAVALREARRKRVRPSGCPHASAGPSAGACRSPRRWH